jgi:imidazolonepropionase
VIQEARVERRGAELVVSRDGRTVRMPARRLGGRLATAAVAPGWRGVALVLADGTTREVSEAELWPAPDAPCQTVIIGAARVLTMVGAGLGELTDDPTIAVRGGRIAWLGPRRELGAAVKLAPDALTIDAAGGLVTPGLVEPHAHPIFAGSRAAEFAARAAGATYLEIAETGGGIASTVRMTRLASDADLLASTRAHMRRLAAWGVTTCEAKTGYDLTEAGELRLLELLAEASGLGPIELSPTLLAAHAVPPEARGDVDRRADWVRAAAELCARARGLAESVDVYCDQGAYTVDEARAIAAAAQAAGLPIRLHADQLAAIGASQLAAEVGALTVDHLEHLPEAAIPALARAGTIAVLLPGASLNLGLPMPPARKLLDAGVPVALGTDLNPGSSMTEALPLQLWLACTQLGMTVDEAWLGVTRVAARAALRPEAGQLRVGAPADLVLWDTDSAAEVPYHYGANLVRRVLKDGHELA